MTTTLDKTMAFVSSLLAFVYVRYLSCGSEVRFWALILRDSILKSLCRSSLWSIQLLAWAWCFSLAVGCLIGRCSFTENQCWLSSQTSRLMVLLADESHSVQKTDLLVARIMAALFLPDLDALRLRGPKSRRTGANGRQ